jgi:GH25 family lysozyme M1 (1,4-beta-N-acetylmuramidase)
MRRSAITLVEGLESRTLLSRAVGIDVSDHQHSGGASIEWAKVYNSGVQFAYIKATQANNYYNTYFASDAADATAASVVVGAYDFADYTVNPTTEANHYLTTAGPYVGAGFLRPMIDVEAATSETAAQVSTWVNTWCNAVYQATGVKPIVYTYVSYAQTYLNSTVTQWPLWMANYNGQNSQTGGPSSTSPWSSWNIWQYSSSGSVNGISGNVDMDVANGDMTSYVIPQLVGGSTQFSTGEVVYVNSSGGLKAWNTYASNGTYVTEPDGTSGTIKGGPVYINGYLRWPIQYSGSSSVTWSAGAYLAADVPSITSFSGSPNPATVGTSVTLTANATDPMSTISSVLFYRESDGISGLQNGRGGDTLLGYGTSNGAGAWTISTSTAGLSGSVTYYAVATNAAATSSAPASTSVTVTAVPSPALTGAPVINGDNPNGLYNAPGQPSPGAQRSMIEDVVYTFNEPVTIPDANKAFTVALAGQMTGTLPSTLIASAVPGTNNAQWAVSLTGQADGVLASIANGEYSITLNPASVFAAANGTTAMTTGRTDTFYRLFGDINGDEVVNVSDEFQFSKAMTTYTPIFDVNGDGAINLADEFQASKSFSSGGYVGDGFVTTI